MKWRSLDEAVPHGEAGLSLRERLEERKAAIAQYVPAETREVHRKAIEELRASGIEGRVLKPGAQAPAFELQDQNGKPVSSADLLAKGRLVVCFFRGRWCPFCVAQLEALDEALPQIQQAGASVVGISPQTVKQAFFMHDQHKLHFPLLSDAGNQVARQFGLVYRVGEAQQQLYARTFTNLPFINGDTSWELPIPAVFVIDRDGTILFASANADYTERVEPGEIVRSSG